MDSGLGEEDLQGQFSSWNSGSGWGFEVIDFQGEGDAGGTKGSRVP